MIGVFDSGIGGLTVVKEITKQLPGMPVLYLGDTARTPYGNKSPETIGQYALQDARFLIDHGATVIVVACNSASSVASKILNSEFDNPVFEVITPAARRAATLTKKKRVGVIGTRATIGSRAYEQAIHAVDDRVSVMGQACPLFVPLIEEGWAKKGETTRIVKLSLQGLKTKNIDTLILGCTHYPIIRDLIHAKIGKRVTLVDPAEEVVKDLRQYLDAHQAVAQSLRSAADHRFMVTDVTEHFQSIAQSWLKRSVRLEKVTFGEGPGV
ncbi:glutamate racemase [Candidatus Uhrbacteria bacterium]|nr:glutamate racemase [Candidatus Uhrbacteria bacterium]